MPKIGKNVYALDCGDFNTDWDSPTGHSYYRQEKDGTRPSPLLLHALSTLEDLGVREVDLVTREGTLRA